MKKIRRILWILALIGLMTGISGCLSLRSVREPLPEDTLEEFEDALNEMDVDGMLKCMDEQSVKAVTAGVDLMMSIAGAAAGIEMDISAEDLIAMLPLFQEMTEDYGGQSGAPQLDFQVMETYIKGNKATVYFTEVSSGDMATINMVKENDKWLLTLSTRMIGKEDADRVIIAGQEEEEKAKRASDRAERRARRRAEREAEKAEKEDGEEEENEDEERFSWLSLFDLPDRESAEEILRQLLGG